MQQKRTAWVVYRQWPDGNQKLVAGFFDEGEAREEAITWVGREAGVLVGLYTIEIRGEPPIIVNTLCSEYPSRRETLPLMGGSAISGKGVDPLME